MNRKPINPKQFKSRYSFFRYKGHEIEMVTHPPYAWRILIDGIVRAASFAGSLIQAKRHARDLINQGGCDDP